MLLNRSVHDVQEKRANWTEYMAMTARMSLTDLVFMDESAVNTNAERRCAWVIDSAPVNTPVTTTVISGMTAEGPAAYACWRGGRTAARMEGGGKDVLVPGSARSNLLSGQLSAHHAKEVVTLSREAHIPVLYLLPYSPGLNPIGMMWSAMKEALCKLRICGASDPPRAVKKRSPEKRYQPVIVADSFDKDGYVTE